MGIFFDEQLVSTIRVHHVTAAHRDGVAVAQFPDVMNPLLDAGKTFIDPVGSLRTLKSCANIPLCRI
jgi:hypothetical protein